MFNSAGIVRESATVQEEGGQAESLLRVPVGGIEGDGCEITDQLC